MAIRTEMISIAMPQPVKAKFPGILFIPNPTEFFQWGPGGDRSWFSCTEGYTNSGDLCVYKGQQGILPGMEHARSDHGSFFSGTQRWYWSNREGRNKFY